MIFYNTIIDIGYLLLIINNINIITILLKGIIDSTQ